jgi:peptidase S41-like protein
MKPNTWIRAVAGLVSDRTVVCATVALLLGASHAGRSHAQAGDKDLPIDKALRTSIVEAVARHTEDNYVFPDLAKEIARTILKSQKHGDYSDIVSAQALATRLTADMQAVTPDRHLKVWFSFEPRPMEDPNAVPSPEAEAERRLGAIRRNFGIERVEQLDGNVGYLKMTKFDDPALAGATLVAAMEFLANTDALIIDLRYNGGGRADLVTLLTSYFVSEEPIHLVDFYDRRSGETSQSWTLPYVPGPRYNDKPLYILTGQRTFSAAEQFVYCLQKMGRAIVVGETTRGGAHFAQIFQIDPHFAVMVPVGNTTCMATGSNWEGTGITPDVAASGETAARTAHRMALEKLLETTPAGGHADYIKMLVAEMKDEAAAANAAHSQGK